jgi:lipopolysaccharide biosynthesis glycosyltransferase
MIQVAICGDLNVIEGSCALINSILVNSKSDIRINIVTEYVDEYRQGINQWCDSTDVVNIINPNSIDLEELSNDIHFRDVEEFGASMKPNNIYNFIRFYLPQLLPDVDRIISLDSDTIVQSDLKDLYNILPYNYNIGGIFYESLTFEGQQFNEDFLDKNNINKNDKMFNGGVCVTNLQWWRDNQYTEKCINLMKEQKKSKNLYMGGHQSIMNTIFYNLIYDIDIHWNVAGLGGPNVDVNSFHPGMGMGPEHQYKYLIPKANILHWTGNFKPWTMKRGSGRRYCDVWWDYLYYYKEII